MFINISYQETNNSETTVVVNVSPVQHWEVVIIAILIGSIAIAGLIGNSSILLAVSFSRKLHTATNAFVTSLAVTDFLTSFILIWHTVGALGRAGRPTPQPKWICEVTGFSLLAFMGTSTYNMAAIATNRFMRITKPHLYRKIFTPGKITILIALTWTVPVGLLAIVPATGSDICDLSGKFSDTLIFQALIALFVPSVFIFLSYIWIYLYVKRHFQIQKNNIPDIAINLRDEGRKRSSSEITGEEPIPSTLRKGNPPPSSPTLSKDISPPLSKSLLDDRRNIELSKQQIKITKNLFLNVCTFFVCFMPYCILLIFRSNATVAHITNYVTVLPLSNSFINYAIYASKHPDFKIVLRHMMKRSYSDIPHPSRFLKFLLSKKE